MRTELPQGEVTLLFTDIEGSTKLLGELGAESYAGVLAEHRRVLRAAFGDHGGVEVDTQGDALFYAFPTATGAVEAAAEAQEKLAAGPVKVRMGIHTGHPLLGEEGYVGEDVHLGARISAVAHGGQVVLSAATRERVQMTTIDLGEHRLKDIEEALWIYQLGEERFPPIRSISLSNVSVPATPLVGRARELEEISNLFDSGHRFITLTGTGGSGKSRLATEIALDRITRNRNGVFWVSLAGIGEADLVVPEIKSVLGAADDLSAFLKGRELLIVLDNFEHVIDAASDVAEILTSSSGTTLLVTSREALRVGSEIEFALDVLSEADAVALFCERSQREPSAVVRELCRRLDRLPLALELAAARATTLEPSFILEKLGERMDILAARRGAEPRQRSLRATFEWSFGLLDDDEREVLAALGVFKGGFDEDAASSVAGASLDALLALVEKSLVAVEGERFYLLETVRTFVLEALADSGREAEARLVHAEYYLSFAEEGPVLLLSTDELEQLKSLLEREHDNLRAAMDHLQELARTQDALRVGRALVHLWSDRGYIREGIARLNKVLEADPADTAARAWALTGRALLASIAGDLNLARSSDEEAIAIAESLGEDAIVARATQNLGYLSAESGEWEQAEVWLEESIESARAAGDQRLVLWATRTLAWTLIERGEVEKGRALHEANLEAARRASDRTLEAITLRILGAFALEDGRVVEAARLSLSALEILERLKDEVETADAIISVALIACSAERYPEAAVVLGAVEAAFLEFGAGQGYIQRDTDKVSDLLVSKISEEELRSGMDRGRKMRLLQAAGYAGDLLREVIQAGGSTRS